MPEKIKFELNETTLDCSPPCPHGMPGDVGSGLCGRCKYHLAQNYDGSNRSQKKEGENFYVECFFLDSKKLNDMLDRDYWGTKLILNL